MAAIKITWGKAWDSEYAPKAWIFQTTLFNLKFIFNDITRAYPSARSATHRFYWNAEHKFWYTESQTSKEEAIEMLKHYGHHTYSV